MTYMKSILVVAVVALFTNGCAKNSANVGATREPVSQAGPNADLHFKVPEGWAIENPSSSMRIGQYRLPHADGDADDAALVLYYFGQGQGGSVQANIDRWVGQMQQVDGSASKDKAKTETLSVNGLNVTMVDLTGRYTAEMSPGSGTFNDKSDYRLKAAVIETPKGAYFAKLIGPVKTVAKWEQSFSEFVRSLEFK
jgi:hypothetical protein